MRALTTVEFDFYYVVEKKSVSVVRARDAFCYACGRENCGHAKYAFKRKSVDIVSRSEIQ